MTSKDSPSPRYSTTSTRRSYKVLEGALFLFKSWIPCRSSSVPKFFRSRSGHKRLSSPLKPPQPIWTVSVCRFFSAPLRQDTRDLPSSPRESRAKRQDIPRRTNSCSVNQLRRPLTPSPPILRPFALSSSLFPRATQMWSVPDARR